MKTEVKESRTFIVFNGTQVALVDAATANQAALTAFQGPFSEKDTVNVIDSKRAARFVRSYTAKRA